MELIKEMIWIRKLLSAAIVLALCGFLVIFGISRYVKPVEALDLSYSELAWQTKLKDMLVKRKLQAELTGDELTQLVRKSLARKPGVTKDVTVTGARAEIQGDVLQLDITGIYRKRWPFGATLHFAMSWSSPSLVAVHTGTTIRNAGIPISLFRLPPIVVNLGEQLPYPLQVGGVQFGPSSLTVAFRLQL
jgi:hypothetical protein